MLGAGRAVEADHVHPERLEDGEDGGDVGAEQHPAGDVQGHLRLDRDGATARLERLPGAEDRCLDLEEVLGGLDEEDIDTAGEQALGLLLERCDQVAEAEPAQARVAAGGQEPGRAHAAGDEARLLGAGVLIGETPGQPRGLLIELRVRSRAPHSARRGGVDWNVHVSMTSAPTSRKERWTRSTSSGLWSTSPSTHPSSAGPPNCSTVGSRA